MKTRNISNKIFGCGSIIEPTNEKDIFELDSNQIIKLFEDKGVLIFKNFNLNKNNILKFTDIFTQQYANDAQRRIFRFGKKHIRNVDPGKLEMPIHSEASYSPSWPEIIWFYCHIAPSKSGQTTLCDGISLFRKLKIITKNFFLANQIIYDLKIPFQNVRSKTNNKAKLRPWYLENPGVSNCFIDFSNKEIHLKQKRYAVLETRKANNYAFVNHIQIILDRDPQVLGWMLDNGKEIPEEIMTEVKEKTKELTVNINWQNNDLCMIDNKRIMHGRRKILNDEKRDILNIQTLRASFGFGTTTRNSIS